MSVISCDRYGCENVMCSRYSRLYGYICEVCFNELKEGARQNIEVFMSTRKKNKESVQIGWEAELEAEFPQR